MCIDPPISPIELEHQNFLCFCSFLLSQGGILTQDVCKACNVLNPGGINCGCNSSLWVPECMLQFSYSILKFNSN